MIETHPAPEKLAAFRLGKLDEGELDAIERHVAECDSCCRSLKALPDDSFVSLVRDATGTTLARDSTPGADKGAPTWDQTETLSCQTVEVPPDLRDHPRYEILEKLGQGGMGVVYKARHRLMNRVVALKVIHPRLVTNRATVERFRRELMGAARSGHPNIVSALDAERAGETLFLVLEYFPGISLARVIEEHRQLPIALACDYIRQAALGLQHAFEQGLVHRDIKPQNLMVLARGRESGVRVQESGGSELPAPPAGLVKILDFGLARFVSETCEPTEAAATSVAAGDPPLLTQASTLMGTPEYIAPEQAQSASSADIRADIYSLGCTLYHLLAGHTPFPHGSAVQKVKAHLEETPKHLSDIRPEVPAELGRVIDKMLAKDPAQRYQTPVEVAAALTPLAKHEPEPSATVESRAGTSGSDRRRWPFALAGTFAVGVACVLGLIFVPPMQEFAQTVIRIATNKGVLEIEADEDLDITVKQAGKVAVAEILEKKTKRVYELTAVDGEIEAKLPDGTRLKTTQFKLARGGRQEFSAKLLLAALPESARVEAGWVQLFNGKDLAGWKASTGLAEPAGRGTFSVEDGMLVARGNARLRSERGDYANFHYRIEAKVEQGTKGFSSFRTELDYPSGYRVNLCPIMDQGDQGQCGSLWVQTRPWASNLVKPVAEKIVESGDWFTQEVIAKGSHIEIKINGKTVVNKVDTTFARGHVGVDTADDIMRARAVRFKKIEIKELPPTPSQPPAATERDDLAKLKGQWLATLGELSDKALPAKDYEKLEIRFGDTDFEIVKPGQKPERLTGTFKVESAQERIILQFKDGAHGMPCSYRFEGDRLQLDFEGLLALDTMVGNIGDRRRDADLSHSKNNLRQIAFAMQGYHEKYNGLPRAALTNVQAKDGKPLLSWRVAVLPWLEQEELYKAFKLDEPWDSPHNKKLIAKMPPIYAAPGVKTKESGLTHYQVFVGPGTAFEPLKDRPHGIRFSEISDGTSFTLMIVEAAEPVVWTKPDDLPFDAKKPLPKLGLYAEGIHAVFCDCFVGMLPKNIDDKTLRALITRNGGESVTPPFITPQGPRLRLELRRPTEAEKFQGNWRLILGDLDGKPLPADKLPGMEMRFRNGEIEVVVPGQKPIQGTYEIDVEKKQIRIRFKDAKGFEDVWSYRWEGEQLSAEMKGLPLLGGPKTPPSVRIKFERSHQ